MQRARRVGERRGCCGCGVLGARGQRREGAPPRAAAPPPCPLRPCRLRPRGLRARSLRPAPQSPHASLAKACWCKVGAAPQGR